jgi:hypothetical protein
MQAGRQAIMLLLQSLWPALDAARISSLTQRHTLFVAVS